MASYHCTVKAGASSSAAAHADYIEREGKYKTKDRADLEHAESGNLPTWAENAGDFWRASDQYERVNAAGYREFEVSLPRELTPPERLALVRDFIHQELGECHAYTFAIHNPKASLDGGEQPHAHIMFSERHRDGIERPAEQYFKRWNAKTPERGGCRKGDGAKTPSERKDDLVKLRERWAKLQNLHLEKHGHQDRVDHRSLKAQGLDRVPGIHLGPNVAAMVQRGQPTRVGEIWREREADRQDIATIAQLELALQAKLNTQRLQAEADRQASATPDRLLATPPRQINAQVTQTLREHLEATLRQNASAPGGPNSEEKTQEAAREAAKRQLAQLSEQLDREQKELARQRQRQLLQLASRVEKRLERRENHLARIERRQPEKPSGLLAGFKQKAYAEALQAWEKALRQAQKFVDQAKALTRRVLEAAEQSQASGWAKAQLRKRDPDKVERVERFRQAEQAQRLVKMRQELEAKQSRSQDKGWSR